MATFSQRSFASGELSPNLYARADQARYSTGLRQCRNMFVMRNGGAAIRPGFQYIAEARTSAQQTRILPFTSSGFLSFVVDINNGFMRFYKNGVQILNTAKTVTGVTNQSPAVVTVSNHGYSNGQEVVLNNLGGIQRLNGRHFKIVVLDSNTFQLFYFTGNPVDSTTFGAYTTGGQAQTVYELYTSITPTAQNQIQYVQSADVMTLTSRLFAVSELKHTSDTGWTFGPKTFSPTLSPPSAVTVQTSSVGNNQTYQFAATAVSALGEESLPVYTSLNAGLPTAANPWNVFANYVAGAIGYNIYINLSGVYAYLGQSTQVPNGGSSQQYPLVWSGPTVTQGNLTNNPPTQSNPPDFYQSIAYYQQRLLLGSGIMNPAGTITSRTGFPANFDNSKPTTDSDSISFSILGRLVQEIRHYIDLGSLVCLTDQGEFVIEGNGSGVMTPSAINLKQTNYIGSSLIPPLVIANSAIFVQARGNAVFDLGYDFGVRGFQSNEMSLYSNHLVDNFQIVAWAYQKRPHQVVWIVRSDGALLGLTYVKGEEIVAWHRHDTQGFFEDVVCVPEGSADAVYVMVRRVINGVTKRYLERMNTNVDGDDLNPVYMDSAVSYDGRNTNTTYTMTLSGGVNWTYDETMTLTANTGTVFLPTDVGNEIQLTGSDGSLIRFAIQAYVSPTSVTGKPNRTVTAALRNVATSTWSRAIKTMPGLYNLENCQVSVVGDGFVVSNPNRPTDLQITVTGGSITLDRPYAVIHVGLPYLADMETLDVDTTQGPTMVGKEMIITAVHVHTLNTRGLFVGAQPPTNDAVDPLQNLTEMKPRSTETMDQRPNMETDVLEVNIQGNYTKGGRVFIRQVDPLPTNILAISPAGFIPQGG